MRRWDLQKHEQPFDQITSSKMNQEFLAIDAKIKVNHPLKFKGKHPEIKTKSKPK